MAMFRKMPQPFRPFLQNFVPLVVLKPEYEQVGGVNRKVFPKTYEEMMEAGILIQGSFKTMGGTERVVNGLYVIEDTAQVETWYNPDITSDCRILLPNSKAVYEIMNEPENIHQRNQFMGFQLRRVKGGA